MNELIRKPTDTAKSLVIHGEVIVKETMNVCVMETVDIAASKKVYVVTDQKKYRMAEDNIPPQVLGPLSSISVRNLTLYLELKNELVVE